MDIKIKDNKYKCYFCEKNYKSEEESEKCFIEHNLIFVPMTAEELNHLMRYIYEQQNPPIELIERLKKIMRKRAGKTH